MALSPERIDSIATLAGRLFAGGGKLDAVVRGVREEPDLTTIVLGNKTIFGDSTITMMFDSKTYELRQWTITDAQNKDTSVMIYNVKNGVGFDERVFRIPYDEVRKL